MTAANWQCPSEWSERSDRLAAGLRVRDRWRLPVLLTGILFAAGRRTVSSWLCATFEQDFHDVKEGWEVRIFPHEREVGLEQEERLS